MDIKFGVGCQPLGSPPKVNCQPLKDVKLQQQLQRDVFSNSRKSLQQDNAPSFGAALKAGISNFLKS